MPILNYTTTIDARKTALEVLGILADAGVRSVNLEYGPDRSPAAITFQVEVHGQFMSFRLPSRWEGVHKLLKEDPRAERRYRTEEQAKRVAWRIVKDWVEAQVAIIQAGAAELAEVFLPYAVNPRTGQTMFEEFDGRLRLAEPKDYDADVKWIDEK